MPSAWPHPRTAVAAWLHPIARNRAPLWRHGCNRAPPWRRGRTRAPAAVPGWAPPSNTRRPARHMHRAAAATHRL